MATSAPNSTAATDRILVKGIPSSINSDKLTIYFQKRKFGGGDVRAVTLPLSSKEPGTAIVIFEEAETVQSVLRHSNHNIGGKPITVTPLPFQPKIFESIVAQVSGYVVQKIKSTEEDIDDVFESISDSTGCTIASRGQTYEVKGEWYQVQAAFDRLEAAVSDSLERGVAPTSSAPLNGYLSSPSGNREMPPVATPAPTRTVVATPPPTRNVVSTMIDKDIYAYMEKVHKNDLDGIKRRFVVDFVCKNLGDAAKIEVGPMSSSSDPESAAKALEDLQQSVQNSAGQDIVEIDSKLPPNTVENILPSLLPEFPEVHMARVDAAPNQVIIVAPNAEKCRMAVDMLKHYLRMAQPTPRQPNAGSQNGSNSPSVKGQENKIAVDKDIFEFLKLIKPSTLERIWDSNGAKILVSVVGDCSNIELVSKGSSQPFQPSTAIDQFQRIYSKMNDTACQEMYDLGTLKEKPSDWKVEDGIRMAIGFKKDILITRMFEDKSQVLFIAEEKGRCEEAMKMFARIVGGGQ